jgi:hypothetical protein
MKAMLSILKPDQYIADEHEGDDKTAKGITNASALLC